MPCANGANGGKGDPVDMFTVIITEKGGDQRRMDFDKPEVTIGRVQGNDIILPKGNVSKRHSRIVLKDGKFIIVDLKSTNGTYVNGRKITSPLVIKDSDKIYIGDFILSVEEAGAGASASGGAAMSPPAPHHAAQSASAPPLPPPEPDRLNMVPTPHASPPPPPRKTAPPPAPARRPPPMAESEPEDLGDDMEEDDEVLPQTAEGRATAPRPAVNPPPGLAASLPPQPSPMAPPPVRPAPRAPEPAPGRDPLAARAAAVSARESGARPAISAPPPEPPPSLRPNADMAPRDSAAPSAPMSPAGTAPARPAAPRLVGAGAPAAAAAPAPAPMPPPMAMPAPAPHVEARPAAPSAPVAVASLPAPMPLPIAAPVAAAPPDPKRTRALELQREIHDRLVAQLDLGRVPVERLGEESLWQRAESAICDLVEQMDADGHIPQFIDQDALIKDALNEALGLGPLEDLLADEAVSGVMVNRPDRVLVERGGRLEPFDKAFSSDAALRQVIERLVAPSGRKIDEASPLIDIRLRDGARLTAAVPPLAVRGACLTLRKPRKSAPSLDDLVRANALSAHMAEFLGTCVLARRNVVVSGSAGAGKTTVLGAVAGLSPAVDRVVSVEDVAELALNRDHWIALEARPPENGKGGVAVADVLRAALRMRPERLVVGEAAGAETFPLLLAMAAAHDGTLVSVVADSARDALGRLEAQARLSYGEGSARGLRELVANAVHIVVHVTRYGDGVRRVSSIVEVSGVEPGDGGGYTVRELFSFHAQGRGADGTLRGRFAGAGIVPKFFEGLEARGIPADPGVFK